MTQRKLPPRMEIRDCTGVMAGTDSAAVTGVLVGCCWPMVCRCLRVTLFFADAMLLHFLRSTS